MTYLFGGFGSRCVISAIREQREFARSYAPTSDRRQFLASFYQGYEETWPLPEGHEKRRPKHSGTRSAASPPPPPPRADDSACCSERRSHQPCESSGNVCRSLDLSSGAPELQDATVLTNSRSSSIFSSGCSKVIRDETTRDGLVNAARSKPPKPRVSCSMATRLSGSPRRPGPLADTVCASG
eukprot:scaffold903_cov262-Pinguiococcus_pyrenoidosus.AAC.2